MSHDKEEGLSTSEKFMYLMVIWIFVDLLITWWSYANTKETWASIWKWTKRIFYWYAGVNIAMFVAWVSFFAYTQTSTSVHIIFYMFAAAVVGLLGYNLHNKRAKEKENIARDIEIEVQEDYKRSQDVAFLVDYLVNLPFHYYHPELEKFTRYIVENNFLSYFHSTWDDTYRLHMMGKVTGKYYVCDLSQMTDVQEACKRESAWESRKNAQRQLQLKKNAEEKKARNSQKQ
jgi:hypothetical protein